MERLVGIIYRRRLKGIKTSIKSSIVVLNADNLVINNAGSSYKQGFVGGNNAAISPLHFVSVEMTFYLETAQESYKYNVFTFLELIGVDGFFALC